MPHRSTDPVIPQVGMVVRETWELLAPLGKGSFGVVFEARHRGLDRIDAIKLLHPYFADDEELRRRFQDEARIMARLRGQHLITVYDCGEHEGLPFFVMERLQGESLHTLIAREAPVSAEAFFRISEGLLRGLEEIHGHGILHRDIKPANIFVEQPCHRVKVLDFGLAKTSLHISSRNQRLGTPIYMAPELLVGLGASASIATDLYAAGVVLYQLLTGTLPFALPKGGDVMALLQAVTNTTIAQPVLEGSASLRAAGELVVCAMDKIPRRRPSSARDFLVGILAAQDGVSPVPRVGGHSRPEVSAEPEAEPATRRFSPPLLDSLSTRVVLSFSEHDETAALRLAEVLWLRNGVPVELGVRSRRSAGTVIEDALAVVLVVSPDSGTAAAVNEDVELARSTRTPVIPVWVRGDRWADCVDHRLGMARYVDARDADRDELGGALARALRKAVTASLPPSFLVGPPPDAPWRGMNSGRMRPLRCMPPGLVLVEDPDALGSGRGVCIRLDGHRTVGAVLDAVYRILLADRHSPYSYGKEWILMESRPEGRPTIAPRVAVPWWWRGPGSHDPQRLARWMSQTRSSEPGMDGHPERACWRVVRVTDEPFSTTVAADDPRFFAVLEHQPSMRSLFEGLASVGKLRPWDGFYRADYREARVYSFPRGKPRGNDGSSVIVQANEFAPDDPRLEQQVPSMEQFRAWLRPATP